MCSASIETLLTGICVLFTNQVVRSKICFITDWYQRVYREYLPSIVLIWYLSIGKYQVFEIKSKILIHENYRQHFIGFHFANKGPGVVWGPFLMHNYKALMMRLNNCSSSILGPLISLSTFDIFEGEGESFRFPHFKGRGPRWNARWNLAFKGELILLFFFFLFFIFIVVIFCLA